MFVCGITDFFLICLLSFSNNNLRCSSVPSVWHWVVWFLFFYLYAPPDDQTPLPLRVCLSVFPLSRKIPIPALPPPTSAVSIHLLPSASAYKITPPPNIRHPTFPHPALYPASWTHPVQLCPSPRAMGWEEIIYHPAQTPPAPSATSWLLDFFAFALCERTSFSFLIAFGSPCLFFSLYMFLIAILVVFF